MNTRKFGGIGLVALALAMVGLVVFAQRGQTQEKNVGLMDHNEMMQSCAKACSDCQRACDSCATHCTHLLHAGKKEHVTTLMTCLCRRRTDRGKGRAAFGPDLRVLCESLRPVRHGLREVRRRQAHEGVCRGMPQVRECVPGDGEAQARKSVVKKVDLLSRLKVCELHEGGG